jgi:ATP-dependent RNA helicase DeaD
MKREIENYTKQKIEPLKLPTQADVAARRITLLKERIINTLTEQDLELYLSLVEDVADESECDIAEIAAAAVFLAVGDKTLEVGIEPEKKNFKFSEEGMVSLFINVGRRNRVNPGDIVGAIANEGDVPGKAIGAIDVFDRYTLVDIPAEYVEQVLNLMQDSRIRKEHLNIRLASTGESSAEKSFGKRDSFRDRKPARKREKYRKPGQFEKRKKTKRKKGK